MTPTAWHEYAAATLAREKEQLRTWAIGVWSTSDDVHHDMYLLCRPLLEEVLAKGEPYPRRVKVYGITWEWEPFERGRTVFD